MTDHARAVTYPPSIEHGTVEPHPADEMIGKKWDRSVMSLNVDPSLVVENIKTNIRRQLPQACPSVGNTQTVAIVGGGWSLNDPKVMEELRDLTFAGVKIVALNGAAKWLLERNLRPSMHLILDARPDNAEFVTEKPIPGCKMFVGSQANPAVFERCAGRDTTIFHVVDDGDDQIHGILREFYAGRYAAVQAAGTVGMVAIILLYILGIRSMHLFGLDSCYSPEGAHHAYPQPLNDDEGSDPRFEMNGRFFRCSAWQASQATTFADVIKAYGDKIRLAVHGDGLLAHMLKVAADSADLELKETM